MLFLCLKSWLQLTLISLLKILKIPEENLVSFAGIDGSYLTTNVTDSDTAVTTFL